MEIDFNKLLDTEQLIEKSKTQAIQVKLIERSNLHQRNKITDVVLSNPSKLNKEHIQMLNATQQKEALSPLTKSLKLQQVPEENIPPKSQSPKISKKPKTKLKSKSLNPNNEETRNTDSKPEILTTDNIQIRPKIKKNKKRISSTDSLILLDESKLTAEERLARIKASEETSRKRSRTQTPSGRFKAIIANITTNSPPSSSPPSSPKPSSPIASPFGSPSPSPGGSFILQPSSPSSSSSHSILSSSAPEMGLSSRIEAEIQNATAVEVSATPHPDRKHVSDWVDVSSSFFPLFLLGSKN